MAKQSFVRNFPGKTPQDIYEATRKTLEETANRYSLKHETDAAKLSGSVARTGASGRYQIAGEQLTLELEFGMLIPGAIRKRVADEVEERLNKLFG